MLTRFVRIQLIIFTVASVIGITAMIFQYIQVPVLFGLGRITVKMELPATGGLYRFANVTYRGVEVGKVTAVNLTATGAEATLSLATSPKIPADLVAEVGSVSAVGEQFVDLQPRNDSPPYLRNGSVIAQQHTTIPQPVGPMLDRVSALISSVPRDKLAALLDESGQAVGGKGYDLGSLLDSSAKLSADADGVSDQTQALIDNSGPLLEGQVQSADTLKSWARHLAGVSEQIVADDPQVRTILRTGPGAAHEVTQLLNQIKPTLPVLLANLTTLGQIAVTYNPAIEQILVLLPPVLTVFLTAAQNRNPTGIPLGNFRIESGDPPACTVGFLPPSQWRSPADQTTADTPDGLYCKLPQDSPIAVRGVRNSPCMSHPGKRAPTVEICDSDQPYEPLAMRQHVLGPYPFDPNLVGQGIPLDDKVTFGDQIFAPVQGTPPPPNPNSAPTPAPPDGAATPGPADNPAETPTPPASPPTDDGSVPATPSSNTTTEPAGPRVAFAKYDPQTGSYVASDGQTYQQSDLAASPAPRTWQDLLPNPVSGDWGPH